MKYATVQEQTKAREARELTSANRWVAKQKSAWEKKFAADPSVGKFSEFKNYL